MCCAAIQEWATFWLSKLLIDINYSTVINFDEMDFVVPGPGADGLRKCFGLGVRDIEADLIRYMSDTQEEHFARLGLRFWYRWTSLATDRLPEPVLRSGQVRKGGASEITGYSGRTRIKQRFTPVDQA